MKRTKVMWGCLHVPSNSWDRGHTSMTLYPTELDAKLAECPNSAFKPIKLLISEPSGSDTGRPA